MKFLHLSDLHIHTHDCDNAGVGSILSYIAKAYPEHYLIITGDITDDGTDAQYANAFQLLSPFKGRLFIAPGNHDYGVIGSFYSYERALRFDQMLSLPLNQGGTFKGDATPVVNLLKDNNTEVMLIALDSNLETEQPFDFACGEIGDPQLKALNTILTSTAKSTMVKLLFFHHHPFMVNDPFMEMKDAASLARVVFNKVDLILFGHKHVMAEWEGRWGARYMLASDNSSGKSFAKEITILGRSISVKPTPIA